MMRRLLLAPLLALVLALGVIGVASGKTLTAEVTGEAYFTDDGFVLHEGPTPIGRDGWWKDRVTLRAVGTYTLPTGPVEIVADSMLRRHYNDEFYRYSFTEEWPGDWDGFAVGRQVAALDNGVTCEGPVNVRFGPDYDAPARSQLRCDDGSHLWLRYDGSSDVFGMGYPDITGVIRY